MARRRTSSCFSSSSQSVRMGRIRSRAGIAEARCYHPEAESLRSRPRDKDCGQARGVGSPRAVRIDRQERMKRIIFFVFASVALSSGAFAQGKLNVIAATEDLA